MCGILKTMAARKAFLSDVSHRIRFVYTPKHSSWLNQIEIIFGIIHRKCLRGASFKSVAELQSRLLQFRDYYNTTMAHPFRWTYTGKPQQKVKWFKDWLVKPRGEDLLRGQIWLLRPDLKHHIIVKARLVQWTPDRVITAALSALELYQAALEGRRDPRWALARSRDRVQAAMKAAYYEFPRRPTCCGERDRPAQHGPRLVSVVETGCSTG